MISLYPTSELLASLIPLIHANRLEMLLVKFLPEIEGVYPTEESVFGTTELPKPFKVKLMNRFN